jgi:hypothetical protein
MPTLDKRPTKICHLCYGTAGAARYSNSIENSINVQPSYVTEGIRRDVSWTRLGARRRVPESWQAPGHSKMYGAGPVGSQLVELNYEAFCIGLPRYRDI